MSGADGFSRIGRGAWLSILPLILIGVSRCINPASLPDKCDVVFQPASPQFVHYATQRPLLRLIRSRNLW